MTKEEVNIIEATDAVEEAIESTEHRSTEEIVREVLSEHYGKQYEEPKIETPKRSWIWIKNSNGDSSASITFLFIAFWVTTFVFMLGHMGEIGIGDVNLQFKDFDSTAAAVYYVPLMMLYFKRREFESGKPGSPGLLELALTRGDSNAGEVTKTHKSKHPNSILGLDAETVSKKLVNLRFDYMADLFGHFNDALRKMANDNAARGRGKLAMELLMVCSHVRIATEHLDKAWEISKNKTEDTDFESF